jgi:hypothetical protein
MIWIVRRSGYPNHLLPDVLGSKLWGYKSETSVRSTQRLLNSLIINTLENGAVTTLFVALSLAFYLSHPKDFLNQAL